MVDDIQKPDKLFGDIKDSYEVKRLIPFIGSGFPKNIGNFPDWNEFVNINLVTKLAEEKINIAIDEGTTLTDVFNGSQIRATEFFVYKIGKKRADEKGEKPKIEKILDYGKLTLQTMLMEQFDKVKYHNTGKFAQEEWEVYKNFILLKHFNTIYTTNWDRTLEEINDNILDVKDKFEPIISSNKLRETLLNGKSRLIVKYHGDYKFAETIIATESDYFMRLLSRDILDIKLQHDLLHFDFLFLGFSLNDLFIRFILYQINYLLRNVPNRLCPNLYLIFKGKPNNILDDYHKINRIKTFNICLHNKCKYINENNLNCKAKIEKNGCKLKSYFNNFFAELKTMEDII